MQQSIHEGVKKPRVIYYKFRTCCSGLQRINSSCHILIAEQSLAEEPLTARSETTQKSWRFGKKNKQQKNNSQPKVNYAEGKVILQKLEFFIGTVHYQCKLTYTVGAASLKRVDTFNFHLHLKKKLIQRARSYFQNTSFILKQFIGKNNFFSDFQTTLVCIVSIVALAPMGFCLLLFSFLSSLVLILNHAAFTVTTIYSPFREPPKARPGHSQDHRAQGHKVKVSQIAQPYTQGFKNFSSQLQPQSVRLSTLGTQSSRVRT